MLEMGSIDQVVKINRFDWVFMFGGGMMIQPHIGGRLPLVKSLSMIAKFAFLLRAEAVNVILVFNPFFLA